MYKFSDRIKDLSGAATREILKLTQRPNVISFAGGMPAAECLPCDVVREISNELLSSDKAGRILQYGTTEGCPELNEQLIAYLRSLGLNADYNNIQVVSGGQQGLDLTCKAFVNTGDTVLVENPTYLAFLQIAKTYQANLVGVHSDDDGLILTELEDKLKKYSPKLLYTVPTFSNPTGKTYSAENRKAIAELCAKYGAMVIEDDPYGRLRFSGESVPLLKSFDTAGNVIYITSFSKTVAPGLRVAVAHGAPEVIRKISIGKQGTDVQCPALTQLIVAEYLKRGYLEKNVNKSLPIYRARKNAMTVAINKYMPSEARFTDPQGGLFIWGELPKQTDCAALLPAAIEKNVAYISGNEFFCDGTGRNTVRLNYSNSDEQKIDKGIKIISDIFKKSLTEKI